MSEKSIQNPHDQLFKETFSHTVNREEVHSVIDLFCQQH